MSKQNISDIVRGAGLAASIWTVLDKEVRKRGGTEEDLHRLATPGGENLIDKIANIIVEVGKPKAWSRVIAIHTITCKGDQAPKLAELGRYVWHSPAITNELFPIQPHAPATRTLEFIECDYAPGSKEAIEELKRHGLERPTHEDALQFGVERPKEQCRRPIVFLHEPVQNSHGTLAILVLGMLDGDAGRRCLDLHEFEYMWHLRYVFAGVRNVAISPSDP